MDLSQYSTEDLLKIAGGQQASSVSSMSNEELMKIAGIQQKPQFTQEQIESAKEQSEKMYPKWNGVFSSGLTGTGKGLVSGLERVANGLTFGGYDWASDKLGLGSKERKQEIIDEAGTPAKVALGGTEFVSGMIPSVGLWKGAGKLASSIPTATKTGKIGSAVANALKYPFTGGLEGGLSAGFDSDFKRTENGLISGAVANSILPLAGYSVKKVGGKLLPKALSLTTGASDDTIKKAYEIGKSGNKEAQKQFSRQIRGKEGINDLLDDAESALKNIQKKAGQSYKAQKEIIFRDTTPLDVSDILNTTKSEIGTATYNGKSIVGKSTLGKIKQISNAVNKFKNENTVAGLDAMKRSVQAVDVGSDEFARRIQTSVSNSIKSTITSQSPEYAKLQKSYFDAKELMKDIKQELKVGGGNRATTTRSIMQAVRNNVNANFGRKADALALLEKEGGKNLTAGLVGQELSSAVPRGLNRLIPQVAAMSVGGVFNPSSLLVGIPASSPKLVGLTANALGKLSNKTGKIVNPDIKAGTLLNIINTLNKKGE